MGHDRAQGDTYPITHKFLAMMLGARRAGVSVAAGLLQKAGLIRYGAGQMTITDRAGLESSSCECYGSRAVPMSGYPASMEAALRIGGRARAIQVGP
jgi:hypothetical protein